MKTDYLQLKFPPGMSRPGTVYDARGRWYGGNLVRWFNGVMQAWGGWAALLYGTGSVLDLGEPVRGMHAWRRNTGAPLLAIGTPTKLYIYGGSSLSDKTPGGFTTGAADASQTSGAYGQGAYGVGLYGVGDPAIDSLTEANTWQMDNWHEDLVACAYSDGKIYLYDVSAGTCAALTNAPTSCEGVVVTPENFVVALGPSDVPRRLQWPDVDDPTVWTADVDNFAGQLDIRSEGRILAGRATSRETLIWTDVDVWAMRYIGGEFVYGAQQVGRCSLISRRAMSTFNDKAVWMGERGFFIYDGESRPLPSDVADYVFNDINRTQASKIHAYSRSDFREVVWHYPSGTSIECDKYVVYNWEGNFFYVGNLDRTAGVDAGIFPYPIAADSDGVVYRHESGSLRFTLAAAATLDQYATTNQDSSHPMSSDTGAHQQGVGQSVRLSEAGYVTAVSFFLSKFGSPTGNAVAKIYATSGTHGTSAVPTGTALATSGNVDVSTLTGSYALTEFTFSQLVLLSENTTYCVVIEYSGGDVSNYVQVGIDATAPAHAGNDAVYFASAWGANPGFDVIFTLTGRTQTDLTPYAESGPWELGAGARTMDLLEYIPDEKTLGDVSLTIYTSYFPTEAETTNGPYTAAEPTSLRLNARQARIRIDEVNSGWRFGTPRFDARTSGFR